MTTKTFQPRSKSVYKGKFGKILMSFAGQTCIILGETTYPPNHTQDGKSFSVVFIKFPNHVPTFQVRPQDVI